MEYKLNNRKDETCIKRKKLKIYSEFNNLPKTRESLVSHADVYSQFRELRPKTDYIKSNKSAHDEYPHRKAFKDDTIIDVYQRNRTLHTSMPKANNIYLYDTKQKCYYTGFKSMCAENSHCKYSGTDVNRLLIFMEYTNNTIQRLLKDFRERKLLATPDLSKIILVIDSKKLKKIFNINKYTRKQNFLRGDFNYKPKDTSLLLSNVTNNYFDITIEQRCGFKISISKYSYMNLLETLMVVCNLSRYFFPVCELKVPSLSGGNWYFLNISQGILLTILLRNINVITLNVMRKLYFVLITENTANLNIQIHFKLKQEAFTVYGADSSNTFLPGTVYWSFVHQHILRKSTSIDSWNILNKLNNKQQKVLNAITYMESAASDCLIDKSLRYEFEESSKDDDEDDTSIPYSDAVFDQSNTTINLTVNRSVATSFILSTDELSSQYRELEKKSVSTLCNIKIDSNGSLLLHSKLFLSKLLQGFKILNNCLNIHSKHDYINETMFDSAPADVYVKFVDKCWKQFTCQKLYIDFFKSLTQTLVYTLFSYKI